MAEGIGNMLQSVGSSMPSFIGGSQGMLGSGFTDVGNWLTGTSGATGTGMYAGPPDPGITSTGVPAPSGDVGTGPYAGPASPGVPPYAGGMSAPPVAGAAPTNTITDRIFNTFFPPSGATGTGTGAGAGAGGGGGPSQLGPLLGAIGTGTTDILKYIQQRNLLNNLSGQATALSKPMNANMIRNITGPVKAMGQETGQINSPYLMDQATATAAAPYAYDQSIADMQAALQANQIAAGMYPNFNLPGFVTPGIFGGGATS